MSEIIVAVIAIFASSGFWSWLGAKQRKESAEDRMILGICYMAICQLCGVYISRGYITRDEYTDLNKYLYEPYRARGGDGTCERLMIEVNKLPLKEG